MDKSISKINKNLTANEIEKVVLGTLLIDSKIYSDNSKILSDKLFSKDSHKIIFKAIEQLCQNNITIDMVIVIHQLKKNGKLEEAGGDKYVIDLALRISSSVNFTHYLVILTELATKRDLIERCSKLSFIANKPDVDIFELRNTVFDTIENLFINEFIEKNEQENSLSVLLEKYQSRIGKEDNIGLPTSLEAINNGLGGFKKGNLSIIAGRPGMGKTALMTQMIIDISRADKSVGVFSLEMSSLEMIERLITNFSEISNNVLRHTLSENYHMIFIEKKHELKKLKIHISDSTSLFSIENLYMHAKMQKMRYGIDILFVDYLQLISCAKSKDNRVLEISIISRKLKSLAKELDIPVVALSQLSRNVENRPNKRPMLSDLRDSGTIEQDADEVIFLYRPEYYNIETWDYYDNESTMNEAEIIISKNRHGKTGAGRCKVDLSTSRFMNV